MSEHMSASIPLYGIRAELSATPGLIEGVLEQTYVNVEQVPVEAVYTFLYLLPLSLISWFSVRMLPAAPPAERKAHPHRPA